jgi:glycosyltransferase involved in cell wall biosynthesis
MREWSMGAVTLAKQIDPNLIRCHGAHLNAFLAAEIKKELNTPFIISLHGNPDVDYLRGRLAKNFKDRLIGRCLERVEKYILKYTNHVIAVYSPIIPYLVKNKVNLFSIIYNVVGINVSIKKDYVLRSDNVKILCVGRQTVLQKDPTNIIAAVSMLPKIHLTLVGDGDLHDELVSKARKLECSDRITFIKNISNDKILSLMKEVDLYVYHSINYEISKTCIEAALVGLPVVLNDREGSPAQELLDAGFYLVNDSKDSYKLAIEFLMRDEDARTKLAHQSHKYALRNWAPEITEKKLTDLYESFMK